jgi:hypothetical protein
MVDGDKFLVKDSSKVEMPRAYSIFESWKRQQSEPDMGPVVGP